MVKEYVAPDKIFPKFKEVYLISDSLLSWYSDGDKDKPAILYFHGNGETVSSVAFSFDEFINEGYSVLLAEYPGYATNAGKANEESVMDMAILNYTFLKEKGFKEVILYGFSIGTGVAIKLANIFKTDYLILEAPFSSIADVASYWFKFLPVKPFLKGIFDSERYIKDMPKISILQIHGTADNVVPYKLGLKLFDASPSKDKKLITIDGVGHNELKLRGSSHNIIKWLDKKLKIEKNL